MSENIRIILGKVEIILNLPAELSEYILKISTCTSLCKNKKYDIKVIDNNDSYVFLINNINEELEERCSKENVLFKLMIEIEECYSDKLRQNENSYVAFHGGLSSISSLFPSEICWRDSARSERICSWVTGTNGFAGFLEVNSFCVNSITLSRASSGIASSMETVASKVLMGKPAARL